MHRQTLKQLSAKYSKSIPWTMKQRDEYIVEYKVHNPRPVNLICDATFYGKRKDKLGTLVFKDIPIHMYDTLFETLLTGLMANKVKIISTVPVLKKLLQPKN